MYNEVVAEHELTQHIIRCWERHFFLEPKARKQLASENHLFRGTEVTVTVRELQLDLENLLRHIQSHKQNFTRAFVLISR